DLTGAARAVGSLDGVDLEGQVAALVDDLPVDDALDQGGLGLTGRGRPVGRFAICVQAATATTSGARVKPDSPSKRCSFSSGSVRVTMSPGRTRCDESTIATTSWSAALTWRSSSLPRYSTTSARARKCPRPDPP